MNTEGILFDQRFLDRHAGAIISDSATAIVELVANAWDAYATEVHITWPSTSTNTPFSISDNGKGMTGVMFEKRWRKLDYDRLAEEGGLVDPPREMVGRGPRKAYGRNGRGRHAAFRFSDPYTVTTTRDGIELTYEVRRGTNTPFDISLLSRVDEISGHGTSICATDTSSGIALSVDEVKEIIGSRFLADPNFRVSVDGSLVSFDDLPSAKIQEHDVTVESYGIAHLIIVDGIKADKTTRHHGIAWRVNNRLVGIPGWSGLDQTKVLDGRKTEAKRFQFIVQADFLENDVLEDWSGFRGSSNAWRTAQSAVHSAVLNFFSDFGRTTREATKDNVREKFAQKVSKLAPVARSRWDAFVDQVVDTCTSINNDEIHQLANILANLEISDSKYALIEKLHHLEPGDLDALHQILEDWTVRLAKDALDEIQSRLELIAEMERKLSDKTMEEVADLQPLIEKSLWVFGPEFESLEFTSNQGMTKVMRDLFGANDSGSLLRPDFVMIPDGSVGFYSRDAYDDMHEVSGVSQLVIAEIKRAGVPIGGDQKDQPWKYVKELIKKGLVTKGTKIDCFVLGETIVPNEGGRRVEWDGSVVIQPLLYMQFIRRAEARMLGLRKKLIEAPFLRDRGVDGEAFVARREPRQKSFFPS